MYRHYHPAEQQRLEQEVERMVAAFHGRRLTEWPTLKKVDELLEFTKWRARRAYDKYATANHDAHPAGLARQMARGIPLPQAFARADHARRTAVVDNSTWRVNLRWMEQLRQAVYQRERQAALKPADPGLGA